jgi:hypothetical protein
LKKIYLILLFCCAAFFIKASGGHFPIGARSAGMGNASVSFIDPWSAAQNQAGLGFVREISAGAYYENRFLLKELSVKGGLLVLPVKAGTFGLCITNFGYSLYNESKYSLSFAKAFGKKLSAGITMDYISTKIGEGYGTKGVLAAEVGIQAKPLKGLTIGAHVFNPTRTKIADYDDERLPTIIRLGADYDFSEKVKVAFETEKNISQKPVFKAGLEYKPVKEFYLRIGVSSNPTLSSFGFGINLKALKIDFAANYHQTLGFSPQLGLTYTIPKAKSSINESEAVF